MSIQTVPGALIRKGTGSGTNERVFGVNAFPLDWIANAQL
jgi:hypothetical protein